MLTAFATLVRRKLFARVFFDELARFPDLDRLSSMACEVAFLNSSIGNIFITLKSKLIADWNRDRCSSLANFSPNLGAMGKTAVSGLSKFCTAKGNKRGASNALLQIILSHGKKGKHKLKTKERERKK